MSPQSLISGFRRNIFVGRDDCFSVLDLVFPLRRLRPVNLFNNSIAKGLIIFAFSTITLITWYNSSKFSAAIDFLKFNKYGSIYILTGQIMLAISLATLLWRLILVITYRPVKPCSDEELPMCTIVVPAYNEGSMVAQTLHSVAQSDYPAEKLQIIAVDDGSVDDTWLWIEKAAKEINGRIETIKLPQNCGKRRALFEGFIRGKGEVMVTIDSDSLIDPDTIRCIVSPFVHDSKIGAVAGCVRVLNQHKGIIPRMLEISFAYSFEFMRASQSAINSVFCTPGALSAYRKEPLMKVLNSWVNQTFLGQPAHIGEDRALTNAILKDGYHVTFQSNSIVYTNVPVQYENLCKMFLRWARSNVRETLVMSTFIFSNFRKTPALGARINFLVSAIQMIVPQFLLIGLLCCLLWQPSVFLPNIIFSAGVCGCLPAAFYALRHCRTDCLWSIAYTIFWVFFLSWISVYALFTVANGKWLTRDIKTKKPVAARISA